jgi:RNA polymerase sigma factor (sigma-70 family)
MTGERADVLLRHIHRLTARPGTVVLSDAELVRRFVARREGVALEELIRRHGPMVLGVCRRTAGTPDDAEDAFQATFLLLVRKADSLRSRASVGSWLYGVALRLARKARSEAARRRAREGRTDVRPPADPLAELTVREAQAIFDEELARLPEKYQAPLVLCCLQAKARDEAAAELGCSLNTLKSRLEQARHRLWHRLTRRGLTLPAAALASFLAEGVTPAALPGELLRSTVQAAGAYGADAAVSPRVVALVAWAQRAEGLSVLKAATALALTVGMFAAGLGLTSRVMPSGQGPPPQGPGQPGPASDVQAPTDRFGDPLPPGAVARIGTVRFRHTGDIGQIAFSADGKVLAAADSSDAVYLWDAATGRELRRFEQATGGLVPGVAFSPDGKVLAVSRRQDVRRWDVGTGQELAKFRVAADHAGQLTISPDGTVLACRGHRDNGQQRQNLIIFLDSASGQELHRLEGLTNYIEPSFAFSPDSSTWAYADKKENDVRLFDARTGKLLRRYAGHSRPAATVAFAPDGQTLASTNGYDGNLRFWETTTGKLLPQTGRLRATENLTFSPDGKLLAGGGAGLRPELWNVAAGKSPPEHLQKQRHGGEAVHFSPDGRRLATIHQHTIYLWDVATGQAVRPHEGHEREVYAVTFAPGGKALVSVAGEFGTIRRWEAATGQELPSFGGVRDHVYAAAHSPDGKLLAVGTGNHDGTIWLLDAATGKEVRRLVIPGGYVTSIAFSGDGKTLVSRANAREVHVWDVATGRELRRFPGSPEGHMNVALSPDGTTVADGDHSGTIHLWETASGKESRRLTGHTGAVIAVAFSPDGKLLASAGGDQVIRLWELAIGKELRQWPTQQGWVHFMAFSPDSRTIVSSGADQTVRLWEVATGRERRRFVGHHGSAKTGAFSSDGRLLATGGFDTTTLVWDVTGLAAVGRLPRLTLTPEQLAGLWSDLAHEDAARADRALWTLVAGAEQSVPYLREQLRPIPAADRAQLARWIAALGSESFPARQAASRELAALGERAEPALVEILRGAASAEVRRRAEDLLERLRGPVPSLERLRTIRAVAVLEQIGSTEARQVLEGLARGASGARLTQEAAGTIDRLTRQPGG